MKPMYKLFTRIDCAYCPSVKKFLENKGIAYQIVDCTETPDAIHEAYEHTNVTTVPQLLRYMPDGTIRVCIGMNIPRLMEVISD